MKFHTAFNEERPVRLKESTRQFAWESLHGRYGDATMKVPGVCMDDIPGFESMSELQKYDCAIARIASEAPLRICDNELISGAATLGLAISHQVPAIYRGSVLWNSISHVTLGFDKVLKLGINAIDKKITERIDRGNLDSLQRETLLSMRNTIASMRVWHKRYLDALKDVKPAIYKNLLHVPFEPARNFFEAVQSLWFTFAFVRLCGNWPGIGRIDEMLGDYLKQDLANDVLTLEDAREILASFFIKGCEWIRSDPPRGGGDAQHYQNIILSGIDAHGRDVTNEVTYLVLDIVEELPISDFPIAVRLNRETQPRLLARMAEVIRHGGGVLAAYNESLINNSLVDFGYSVEEARCFANDGCWEVQVPGKTRFSYWPFDALQIFLHETLGLDRNPAHFDSFEELYSKFCSDLNKHVEKIYSVISELWVKRLPDDSWKWTTSVPCSVVSLFMDDCIETGLSYLDGGAKYNVCSPHIGGAPDVGNSLYAIQKLVFDEKKVSFDELMCILQNNWEGHEGLRQYVLNKYTYYGNDNDEADSYTSRVLDDFADMVMRLNRRCPILFPPGVSTFGRQIEWANHRSAVPFGRRKGDILASNTSPTPGTDTEGATAVIKSYCKADLGKQVNGAALDIKLYPSSLWGENGINALVALFKGFLELGGFFVQIDVVDTETLKKARENPADYKTLSVRVAGWSARFVTLSDEWQKMVIERTMQGV